MPLSTPIIFKSDPTKDIINKEEKYSFGELALADDIGVSKIYGDGMESSCAKGSLIGMQTVDGKIVCNGVNYTYTLKSQKTVTYACGVGIPAGLTADIGYEPGEIHIQVSWETFSPAPNKEEQETTTKAPSTPYTEATADPHPSTSSETVPTQEYESVTERIPKTTEEWVEQQKVWREGFNWECENEYSTVDLQHGIERADQDITNDMVPGDDTAKRIGELAVGESERNENIGINTIANWDIKLGDLVETEISLLNKYSNERIESFEIINSHDGEQSVIMNFKGRE
jgi:hypothetical protein